MALIDAAPVPDEATLEAVRVHRRAGRLKEAERLCRRLLQAKPNYPAALYQLGRITNQAGNPEIAAAFFHKAISHDASVSSFHKWLGVVLADQGKLVEAEACLRRAIEIEPGSSDAHLRLGVILQSKFELTAAARIFERAIELDHGNASALANLGGSLVDQGRVDGGIAWLRHALDVQPDFADVHSNLLYLLHYVPSCERETLFAEAKNWGARHAAPPADELCPYGNVPDPERRLRIGYVSGDFHSHPVGYFLEAVLQAHDTSQVEIFCYSNCRWGDDLTRRIRGGADHGRQIAGISDEMVVASIRRDEIDILIDLSGHTAGHRLSMFARKPAPVQASWIGYFDTTGVPAIDYIILDRLVCPPGDERYYSEKVIRLPDSYLCYSPQSASAVLPAPVVSRGHVTFGCFNKSAKVNTGVVALWARILTALPDARLCLKSTSLEDASVRQHYTDIFASHGIVPDRLTLLGRSSYAEHLAAYGEVDVALDPFPFNGGTTTVESLWMGVPVVTLAGDHFVSRMGVTYLTTVGLDELVADSPKAYVDKAVALGSDVPQLTKLRATLRQRMKESPLCDAPRFTRGLEAAYRDMWRTWCRTQSSTSATPLS